MTDHNFNLPDKPSALIIMALEDLEKVEKDPRYVVDMDHLWHGPVYENLADNAICSVCLAGAVMSAGMGTGSNDFCSPENFNEEIGFKLMTINELRKGAVASAFRMLCRPRPADLQYVYRITEYAKDPARFKADMRDLATTLKNAGE